MVKIKGEKKDEASGNKHKEYLIKPKPPNFSRIPAKMTDPDVGASACASGNQIWNGISGILTAKDKKKAIQHNFSEKDVKFNDFYSWKSVVPDLKYKNKIASYINKELTKVYKKSKYEALTLLPREP